MHMLKKWQMRTRTRTCPYCGGESKQFVFSNTYFCPHCEKRVQMPSSRQRAAELEMVRR